MRPFDVLLENNQISVVALPRKLNLLRTLNSAQPAEHYSTHFGHRVIVCVVVLNFVAEIFERGFCCVFILHFFVFFFIFCAKLFRGYLDIGKQKKVNKRLSEIFNHLNSPIQAISWNISFSATLQSAIKFLFLDSRSCSALLELNIVCTKRIQKSQPFHC